MTEWHNLWTFKTARFVTTLDWEWEQYPDISFDETGETKQKCESGEWGIYSFRVRVACDGREVGCDYLGNSIYADPIEFWREHIGIGPKCRADNCNYGTYFHDMLRQAIREARATFCNAPRVRC